MRISRRPILKGLLTLPLIGVAADKLGHEPHGSQPIVPPEFETAYLAIRTLRFINTGAARHFERLGRYPSKEEFAKSQPIQEWIGRLGADPNGFVGLSKTVNFSTNEIVPGWTSHYRLTKNATGYLVVLNPVGPIGARELPSYATDAAGVIYEGRLDVTAMQARVDEARLLVSGHSIRVAHAEAAGIRGALQKLAAGIVVPVSANSCDPCCTGVSCCCSTPCTCSGTCSGQNPGGCANCGCGCCVWCC